MRDVESVNVEFRNGVWAVLPGLVEDKNDEKNDGLILAVPVEAIHNFDQGIPQTTPFAFFDVAEMAGVKRGLPGWTVTTSVGIVYGDLENSSDNERAYYRYTDAVYRAIMALGLKKPYLSSLEADPIPMNASFQEGSEIKIAGCFVKYSVGL